MSNVPSGTQQYKEVKEMSLHMGQNCLLRFKEGWLMNGSQGRQYPLLRRPLVHLLPLA